MMAVVDVQATVLFVLVVLVVDDGCYVCVGDVGVGVCGSRSDLVFGVEDATIIDATDGASDVSSGTDRTYGTVQHDGRLKARNGRRHFGRVGEQHIEIYNSRHAARSCVLRGERESVPEGEAACAVKYEAEVCFVFQYVVKN